MSSTAQMGPSTPHGPLPPHPESSRPSGWGSPGYDAPYGYGPPYPPPPLLPPPPPKETNALALTSVILGGLWIYWVGSVLAVVLGHIALVQIKRKDQSGRELAIAGLILGWLGVAILAFLLVAFFGVGLLLEHTK